MAAKPTTTTKKKTTRKKTAATKTVARKQAAPEKKAISPLERWKMIAEAAYYRAQSRGFFGGNPVEDWTEAEKQIDAEYTVDYGKIVMALNPSDMIEQLTSALSSRDLPQEVLRTVVDAQRRNIEALTSANKRVFEGAKELMERQVQILRDAVGETTTAIKALPKSGSPKDAAAKQGELVRQAVEKSLANMREMAEMSANANQEAFELVNQRMKDSVSEIRALTAKLKKMAA